MESAVKLRQTIICTLDEHFLEKSQTEGFFVCAIGLLHNSQRLNIARCIKPPTYTYTVTDQ